MVIQNLVLKLGVLSVIGNVFKAFVLIENSQKADIFFR